MTQPDVLPMEIDVETVSRRLNAKDGMVLVDCREQEEWDIVHIDGVALWPMSTITERVAELAPHRAANVVVHCHHGGRSMRVVQWLREQGFARAQSMAGGIDAWAESIDRTLARY